MVLDIPLKYRKDIEVLTNLLKKEGCQSIFLFGSLVTGKNHNESDIDIGIKGLPKGKFFETCAKVYFAIDNDIDIVELLFYGFHWYMKQRPEKSVLICANLWTLL